MENVYLLELIACMEREIDDHKAGKYENCDVHANCNERFKSAIDRLKEQYANHEAEQPPALPEKNATPAKRKAVRGEETEAAQVLEKLASQLEKLGITEEAELARAHARELLASQLNEFDGFNFDAEELKKGPAVVDRPDANAKSHFSNNAEDNCRLSDGP